MILHLLKVIFVLLLLCKNCITNDDFDRLPTTPVDYRYFAELDQTNKILGACSEVKPTVPMSRCILKVVHKYKPKYISITFAELVGTGIVIYKSNNNGEPYAIILSAFHIVVPQLKFDLLTFLIITFSTICLSITPIIIYSFCIRYYHLCRLLFCLIAYLIIGSCLTHYILSVIYPFCFDSSFQITLLSDNQVNLKCQQSKIDCHLISSNIVLSYTWWDDIGLINCSNIHINTFTFMEVCTPLRHNTQLKLHMPVNTIGYVAQPPSVFDLILDPLFPSLTLLMKIDSINGRTPSNLLNEQKFMNCSGTLRSIDARKIYIDTPSTYGFSGGPCFSITNTDEWSFIGIFTGASSLWNVCTLLHQSTIFWSYYDQLTKNKTLINMKNDL